MTSRRWGLLALLLWLLAIALATWTMAQLPFGDIAARLGLLGPGDWLLWLWVNIAILYLAVQRWQLLGRAVDVDLSLFRLFRLRQAGSAVSFITPGPQFGGEPLQLYWLVRHDRMALHQAIAVLGLDRFMESGVNIAVLLAGVLTLLGTALLPAGQWLQISLILAALLGVMGTAALVILRHPQWLAARLQPLVRRWRAVRGSGTTENGWATLVHLLQRAVSNGQPRIWLALLISLIGWGALLAELVLLLHLLGLSPSAADVVLIMVGMRLAMLLPVPGGIGTIEASLLWSFQLLGLPLGAAAGLIALIRLRDAVVLIVGLACLASYRGQPDGK